MDFDYDDGKAPLESGPPYADGTEYPMSESVVQAGRASSPSELRLNQFNSTQFSAANLLYDGRSGAAQPVMYAQLLLIIPWLLALAGTRGRFVYAQVERRLTTVTNIVDRFRATKLTPEDAEAAKKKIDRSLEGFRHAFQNRTELKHGFESLCNAAKAEIDREVNLATEVAPLKKSAQEILRRFGT